MAYGRQRSGPPKDGWRWRDDAPNAGRRYRNARADRGWKRRINEYTQNGDSDAKGSLTPEGEVIAAYGAAMVAAFQVLINCLEESDTLLPGQFPDALGVYMEMVKSRKGDVSDMTLAVLHDIRAATLDS